MTHALAALLAGRHRLIDFSGALAVRFTMTKRSSAQGSICLSLCLGAFLALGCGESDDASGSAGAPFYASGGMTAAGQGGAGGGAGAAGFGGSSGAAGAGGAGAGGTGGSSGGATGRASTGTTAMPCDVNEAVQRNCQSCHGAQPLAGVPMALVTWEDFQAPAVSNPSLKVYQLSDMRVHSATSPMPPAPQVLPAEDKIALEQWLTGNAPMGTDPSCAPGGVVDPPDPVDAECYDLLAHNGDKTTPYQVNGEDYVNFFFDAPWPADAQGISFESVFDDHPEVIHHWLLYLEPTPLFEGGAFDGVVQPLASGAHIGSTLIAGWAPGGNNGMNLPPEVGMDINGTARRLSVEIHFYTNTPVQSRSGVRVCTTRTPRPNLATVSWLGTESFSVPAGQMSTATGTCKPVSQQPIHILRSWPHMHKLGRHMTTVINRSGGGTEMLVDEPFNFNTQISYDTPATLMPGDTLTTTCTFQNDTGSLVMYGTKTSDEMCFNFVTAWPAGALVGGMAKNGAQNPCMESSYGF
jgi:hypothetical protein